jgi:hypothetical protein
MLPIKKLRVYSGGSSRATKKLTAVKVQAPEPDKWKKRSHTKMNTLILHVEVFTSWQLVTENLCA